MERVEVLWIDSHSATGWVSLKEAKETAAENNALRMLSIGYLIEDNPEYLLLGGTISPPVSGDDELVDGTMQIPRFAVVSVMRLTGQPTAPQFTEGL